MAITVPVVNTALSVSAFGKPVADQLNSLESRCVAQVFSTVSFAPITTSGWYDIGISVTFTATAGRKFRITFGCNLNGGTLNGFIALGLRKSDNSVIGQAAVGLSAYSTYGHALTGVTFAMKANANRVFSGSTTLKLSGSAAGTTMGVDGAGSPGFIVVEDIGADP